jgi:hydroxylaminobenzene mutase
MAFRLREGTRMKRPGRQLMWYGVLLFLMGLITGLLEQRFTNTRMALAAHLEGVMIGTLLIALGAIWAGVRLSATEQLREAPTCD